MGGSKADFEAVAAFLEDKRPSLESLIDRVFSFEDAPAAFEYLASGQHMGKVVIRL